MSESEDPAMKPKDEIPADQSNWMLPRNLRPIEARLAALSPRDDRLDRERLMFLAGQASVASTTREQNRELESRIHLRAWQIAFGGMTALAASLMALHFTRPSFVEPSTPPTRVVANSAYVPKSKSTADNQGIVLRTNVLSTRDIFDQDFEHVLTKHKLRSSAGKSTDWSSSDIPQPPQLTPAAWRQVFSSPEASAAPSNGASNLPVYRGTRT